MAACNESATQGTNVGFQAVEIEGESSLFKPAAAAQQLLFLPCAGSDLAVPAPADSIFAAVAVYACKPIGKNRELIVNYGPRYASRPYVPRKACRPPRAREQGVLSLGPVPLSAVVEIEDPSESSGSDWRESQ